MASKCPRKSYAMTTVALWTLTVFRAQFFPIQAKLRISIKTEIIFSLSFSLKTYWAKERKLVSDTANIRDKEINVHITKAVGELYPGTLLDSTSPCIKGS